MEVRVRRLGVALAVALGCGAACVTAGPVGSPAPDFTRTDLAGHTVRLADYKGRVVLLNFWASWCAPCLIEMPQFAAWQRRDAQAGLQVIGVSMDDDPAAAARYLAGHPLPYPVLMGDEALARAFGGVYGLPLNLLIDARGRVVFRGVGEPDLDALRTRIDAALRSR